MNIKPINKKIIIFDLDGVILDSIDFLRNYMKNKYEGMTEEDFKEIFLTNFWDGLKHFKQRAEGNYVIHEEYSTNKRAESAGVLIFEGMKEVVKNLSDKYILVINSSDSEIHIKERLGYNAILTFFDFIAGKETSIDKVEKFNIIFAKYGILPNQAIFISDTIGDILESDKVGIDSIAVTWGVHSRTDFEKESFTRLTSIIDRVDDLYTIL